MASQDVIELGSSDDEPEPAPKKMKIKPPPNSMVEIPSGNLKRNNFKQNSNLVTLSRQNNAASVNNKNMPSKQSVYLMKTVRFVSKPKLPIVKVQKTPIKMNHSPANIVTNPIKIMNDNVLRFGGLSPKISNVKSINPFAKHLHNVNVKNSAISNVKTQSQKCLNKLPPSITVRKTSGNEKKRVQPVLPQGVVVKKRKIAPSTPIASEVLTVDLDDDDVSESRPHPIWCLKPEENTSEMEIKNNSESEPQTVEIVIEDSPIKLPLNKFDNNEIGKILEITIDDSPVKLPQTNKADNQSDSSADDKTMKSKRVPSSKKKLEYPNEVKDQSLEKEILEPTAEQMEIDSSVHNDCINKTASKLDSIENAKTEPISEDKLHNINKKENEIITYEPSKHLVAQGNISAAKQQAQNVPQDNMCNIVIEVSDSPAKQSAQDISQDDISMRKVEKVKSVPRALDSKKEEEACSTQREIHPVYQSFIDLCFKIEDTDDMKKIVEKKIKAYYKEVPKEYTDSEEFIEMVSSKIIAIKADPDRMYLYIKDIVDELNMQRKLVKSKNLKETVQQMDDELEMIEVDDPKRRMQIRKLEKALKKLHRAIQKLEEQEVDFDDEADSVYLLTESDEGNSSKDSEISSETDKNTLLQRYKERVVRVHAKLCKLTNTKMPSEPRVHIEARPGRPKGPAQRLEKWINKKVPIGTPLPFPDFHDVLQCVREANEADKLGWNEIDIMEEARDLFMRCGKKLQRRRQENEWRVAASRIPVEVDPAEKDLNLKKKLDENKKMANVKESQIIDKYVDRQNKLKLEPQEIGDKEADQSPMESDDEIIEESKEVVEETNTVNLDKSVDVFTETKSPISNKVNEINTDNKNVVNNKPLSNDENENVFTSQLQKVDENIEAKITSEKNSDGEKVSIHRDTEHMKIDEITSNNKDASASSKDSQIVESKHGSVELISDDEDKKEKSGTEEDSLLAVMCVETEGISTFDSSDVDCPIAISDTVETSSTLEPSGNGNNSSDVVSIQQISSSDSDGNANQKDTIDKVDENNVNKSLPESSDVTMTEVVTLAKASRNSNDEYTIAIEDILLASDDESIPDTRLESNSVIEKQILAPKEDTYINLKDDVLIIEENVIKPSDVIHKTENDNEKVFSVPTESNSSPSVVSLEDTCNTDTIDDLIHKKTDITDESSDDKKENEIGVITNLSSVESICLSVEETITLGNDIPKIVNNTKKTIVSDPENEFHICTEPPVQPIEKNKSDNNVALDAEKNEQEVVKGEFTNDVPGNISMCGDDKQKLLTLRTTDSQMSEAATVLKDAT